jgi:signal transduction histidine kinase
MQAAGRDMEALIEAFLILAREGDTGLPDEDFDAARSLREEIEKARPLLAGKPVELQLRERRRCGCTRPARVFSVLVGNLLRNACHYTDAGTSP